MYHPCLDWVSSQNLRLWRIKELSGFNNMIVAWSSVHDTDIPIPKAV